MILWIRIKDNTAHSLILVLAGTTEYIAAGDSQAFVPFPTEIRRDFDLQWKTASNLSYLLLQLGSKGREASLTEKGATEATSCPKGGNMWRHWYGLTQAWGSITYDRILGQFLPRSREEGCQQNLTESSVKEKTRVYHEGNLAVEEYTYGITWRGIRPYGHLAQYRGWPETRRANTSTGPGIRLLHPVWLPGVLGGFHQGSPSGELNWRRKRRSYPRVRGNGAASVTPASSPVLPAHYLLPNTWEETGSTRRL